MAKWADYCISAVRYNQGGIHLDRVRVHVDDGETIGSGKEMTRAEVVKLIEQGKTFVTIVRSSDQKNWTKGAPVNIFPVETRYLKSKADKRESDNLENLPTI